mgnify:CR=1 FL=1
MTKGQFNRETGKLAVQTRWASYRQEGIDAALKFVGTDNIEEATWKLFWEPLFEACKRRNVAALKLLQNAMLSGVPEGTEGGAGDTYQTVFLNDRAAADAFIEHLTKQGRLDDARIVGYQTKRGNAPWRVVVDESDDAG